jgi:glycolate oxidase iron-sulfur subunit
MMQLRRYLAVPLVHTVELLDWATGGPRPPALAGVSLRTPAPPVVVGDSTGPSGLAGGDIGFW